MLLNVVVPKVDHNSIFADWRASYSVLTKMNVNWGASVSWISAVAATDTAVYTGGARHTKVNLRGERGDQRDIAYALGTPPSDAEAIKVFATVARWVRR